MPAALKSYRDSNAIREHLAKSDPGNAGWQRDLSVSYNNICWAQAIAGQLEAGLADCNESLRLRPDESATLDSRGLVYLKSGDFDKAIADYDAALRISPKLAGSHYGRGIAKLKKGDAAGGDADIASAKAIRADIAEEYARYGVK